MEKKQKWIKKRHILYFYFLRIFFIIYFKIFYRIKIDKFKIKKGEKYIIVSNHQTTMDPFILNLSFNKNIYFVASDDLVHLKYASWWINHIEAVIPKAKGKSDYKTIKIMLQVLHEGGTIGLFPEGNRTYNGELCYISPAIVKFAKQTKTPLLIYNINGGYGTDPRWGLHIRKGKMHAFVKRVLTVEEMENMSVEKIYDLIVSELNVHEVPSTNLYKSKTKAERLERILFLCPECGSVNTLHSKGDHLRCDKCHLDVQYNENLTITKDGIPYKYANVKSWYDLQIDWVLNYNINNDDIIFSDENINLLHTKEGVKKHIIATGTLELTNQHLTIKTNDKTITFDIYDMLGVAAMGKCKLIFRIDTDTYSIEGIKNIRDDFNSPKYVFMINHIHNVKRGGENEFLGI